MEKTASSFFADLNRILHEYLLLECAKITDSASSNNFDNFTIDLLVQAIIWPNEEILNELRSLQKTAEDFRSFIKPARNKLLAHLDREAFQSGEPLGGFPQGEDRKFFEVLQEICNVTHKACFGEIYGQMSLIPIRGGDVVSLRKTLQCAVAFKDALSESSSQSKQWLNSYLQKALH